MQVFAEGKPLRRMLKKLWLGCCKPMQFRGPEACMERGTGACMDSGFVQSFAQFGGGAARTSIFPCAYRHDGVAGGVHSHEAMPEGVGCHGPNVRGERTSCCQGFVDGFGDEINEQFGINRDFAVA